MHPSKHVPSKALFSTSTTKFLVGVVIGLALYMNIKTGAAVPYAPLSDHTDTQQPHFEPMEPVIVQHQQLGSSDEHAVPLNIPPVPVTMESTQQSSQPNSPQQSALPVTSDTQLSSSSVAQATNSAISQSTAGANSLATPTANQVTKRLQGDVGVEEVLKDLAMGKEIQSAPKGEVKVEKTNKKKENIQPEKKKPASSSDEDEEDVEYSREGYPFELQENSFPRMNGTLKPTNKMGRSNVYCEFESCIMENVCVDHSQDDAWFSLRPIDFEPMTFKTKGHYYNLTLTHREPSSDMVKIVNGTTHFFTMDFTNWFFSILKSFSLRRVADIYTGRSADFNMMMLYKMAFSADLYLPFYQAYRAMHPHYAPLYDLRESLHGGESNITCFERGVFGFEYRGSLMTGFTRIHLDQVFEELRATIEHGSQAEEVAKAKRYLAMNTTLATDLREYKDLLLRQFKMEDVQMKPKTALFVARKAGRKGTFAPYRQIINQDELVRVLEQEGYNVTVAEFAGMSVPEQIRLAREANMFIAIHGAGVTNIFWMHEQASVLELHTYGFQKWGYETLATYLGLPYVSWVNSKEEYTRPTWHSQKYREATSPTDNMGGQGQINYWRSRDQWVDPEEFRLAVRQATKKGAGVKVQPKSLTPTIPPLPEKRREKALWAREGINYTSPDPFYV